MYCTECGTRIPDGEQICKGCGSLPASIREEILAMSEKTADLKCEKCGGSFKPEHRYCNTCGTKIA